MSHLTLSDRISIESGLNSYKTKKEIAQNLGKDPSTIGKEIKLHVQKIDPPPTGINRGVEKCIHFAKCKGDCKNPKGCKSYEVEKCNRRDNKPGYCNGCDKRQYCKLHKIKYDAKRAFNSYKTELKSSREGHNKSHENVEFLKAKIAELILQGQSPYAIVANHPEFQISERTIYLWVHEGKFREYGVISLNFKESVKRKVKDRKVIKKDQTHYLGRMYKDFVEAMNKGEIDIYLEMDTVYNSPHGPYILTFMEPKSHFMFGRLLSEKNCKYVSENIEFYRKKLGSSFSVLFPVLLTDRGSEFYQYELLTSDKDGVVFCKIFYCDAMQSSQKPYVENNHNFVRDVLPNERDLSFLTQEKVDLMFSHINSYPRKVLNGRTPYEMFTYLFGEELADLLNIEEIEKDKVNLTPSLI